VLQFKNWAGPAIAWYIAAAAEGAEENDDLRIPFRHVAVFESGQPAYLPKPTPGWLIPLLQSP